MKIPLAILIVALAIPLAVFAQNQEQPKVDVSLFEQQGHKDLDADDAPQWDEYSEITDEINWIGNPLPYHSAEPLAVRPRPEPVRRYLQSTINDTATVLGLVNCVVHVKESGRYNQIPHAPIELKPEMVTKEGYVLVQQEFHQTGMIDKVYIRADHREEWTNFYMYVHQGNKDHEPIRVMGSMVEPGIMRVGATGILLHWELICTSR